MPAYDFTAPRLHVAADLAAGVILPLDRAQANYLLNVLRRGPDDPVLVFNGRHGEWRAHLVQTGRKGADLHVAAQTRPQTERADLHYLFAPLKSARLDYLAQKAVEMGAGTIRPVITRFTQGDRVNIDRLRANAVEAAEQCGILAIPECPEPERLPAALAGLPQHLQQRPLPLRLHRRSHFPLLPYDQASSPGRTLEPRPGATRMEPSAPVIQRQGAL